MPVRKAITKKDGVYFITFTCTNWLPLFKICKAYDTVYNWFNHLKQQGGYIIGYVIMPGHIHANVILLVSKAFMITDFMELRDIDLTRLRT